MSDFATRWLLLALLGGCTPLAAYSNGMRYGKEPLGKDEIAEAHRRYNDMARREAGYPCCEFAPKKRNFE